VLLNEDGKASLDHIYTQPAPRTYFATLRKLDYCIPQLAKPHFSRLVNQLRTVRPAVTVLDIGCSYGINGALLRCDATMDELYERYVGADASAQTRDSLLARDRALVAERRRPDGPRFVGLDVADDALSYARSAGFVDDAVSADLEHLDPTEEQRERLATADLVISTGCIGYITEQTIGRVVRAGGDRPPWMAHFVLRMYPFDPIEECLAGLGYTTVRDERLFKQRMFVSPEEQAQVLETLAEVGVDPRGLEADGWLYARLFISRPRAS
jgi:SAM-dependent methyltransferase